MYPEDNHTIKTEERTNGKSKSMVGTVYDVWAANRAIEKKRFVYCNLCVMAHEL